MCPDKTDVDDTILVLYGHDQPVLVPLDIENESIVCNKTDIAIDILDVRRRFPYSMLGVYKPSLQRLLRIGMSVPKFFKASPGNNPHALL